MQRQVEMSLPSLEAGWLAVSARYLLAIAFTNLAWEFAYLPLYTIWSTGDAAEIVFAAVHCTGGDVLIATASLALALLLGGAAWPVARRSFLRVAVLSIAFGLAYTVFSEWLNVSVRRSWAYSDLMPLVPLLEVGLSPVLQWIVLPPAAFWWARRPRPA
jgi:hypothetical protein